MGGGEGKELLAKKLLYHIWKIKWFNILFVHFVNIRILREGYGREPSNSQISLNCFFYTFFIFLKYTFHIHTSVNSDHTVCYICVTIKDGFCNYTWCGPLCCHYYFSPLNQK